MAFKPFDLSALTYANGFTLWHYRTADAMSEVDSSGYFNAANKLMRVGDFVLVNAGVGLLPEHGVLIVASNTGGLVDLSNALSAGAINAD